MAFILDNEIVMKLILYNKAILDKCIFCPKLYIMDQADTIVQPAPGQLTCSMWQRYLVGAAILAFLVLFYFNEGFNSHPSANPGWDPHAVDAPTSGVIYNTLPTDEVPDNKQYLNRTLDSYEIPKLKVKESPSEDHMWAQLYSNVVQASPK